MKNNVDLLKDKFDKIKNKWYKTHRKGPTGIGKTFEDLLGKTEDNLPLPDFHDIELKAHDEKGNSMITLFTKAPNSPRGANNFLRSNYGYDDGKGIKLHVSVKNKKMFSKSSGHFFQVVDAPDEQSVKLLVFSKNDEEIDSVKWSYTNLEKSINNKIKTLALIKASSKKDNSDQYYSYNSMVIIEKINLQNILDAINNNLLIVDIRLGIYKSGKNKGKTHDHGTGFRIKESDLLKISDHYEIY